MISLEEWVGMSRINKTLSIERNCGVSGVGGKRSAVYGVGINDATFCPQPRIDGKVILCPAYDAWQGMLRRCYSSKSQAKRPTYAGVLVCNEWHSFMSFRAWWMENQVDGWDLDKDILSSSKIYSPSTCIFVPPWLNGFANSQASSRGKWLIGVHLHKRLGRFCAMCRNVLSGRQEHLGYFDTEMDAHLAWLERKIEIALELKPRMDEVDVRIYPRVVEMVRSAT